MYVTIFAQNPIYKYVAKHFAEKNNDFVNFIAFYLHNKFLIATFAT